MKKPYFRAQRTIPFFLLAALLVFLASIILRWRSRVRIHPNYAEAHNNLGNAYQRQGNLEGAIAEFKTAVSIDPNLALSHYNLARAYAVKKEKAASIEFLQKV